MERQKERQTGGGTDTITDNQKEACTKRKKQTDRLTSSIKEKFCCEKVSFMMVNKNIYS